MELIYQIGGWLFFTTVMYELFVLHRETYKHRAELRRLIPIVEEIAVATGVRQHDTVERVYEMVKPFYDKGLLNEVKRIAKDNFDEPSQFKKLNEMLKSTKD